VHCLSSGGILNAPDYAYDMVRPGIVLYGYNPDGLNKLDLRPALGVTAQIVSIKNIAAGEGVSYGASFVARGDKKIAVVLAGYGDGYKRALSNAGRVLIGGRFCKILGSVCMDMFMADISGVNAEILSPVILLGRDGQNAVTASDIAVCCGTICYDVLTGFKAKTPIEYV
jgi:alanine racemase